MPKQHPTSTPSETESVESPTATAATTDTPEAPTDPNAEVITIAWRGREFTIPKRRGRWDIDAIVSFQEGRPLPGLKMLLGDNQWRKLKSVAPVGDDLEAFSDFAADQINENCVA